MSIAENIAQVRANIAAAAREAAECLGDTPHYFLDDAGTAGTIIGALSRMEAVVSMRLHALIFAAGQGIPLAGVVYDPKVSAFLRYIGQENFAGLETLTLDQLKAMIDKAAAQAGKEAAKRQEERLVSAAQMDAKKLLLAAKQACIDEAFDKAQEKLLALDEGEYAQLLARMAVKAAKTGKEEILLNAKDRERVGPQVVAWANTLLAEAAAPKAAEKAGKVGGKAGAVLSAVVTGASALLQGTAQLTLSQETREMAGGLTLRDGNVEVNCAFETQLRVLREEMAAQVAGILFP